ncbi:MAG: hypothetical protein ACFFCM_10000 [Promethearchaeota archaeon]
MLNKEILFKGTISGIVTSNFTLSKAKGYFMISFSMKFEDEIEGLPKELVVIFLKSIAFRFNSDMLQIFLRQDDKVIVKGKIIKKQLSSFSKESIVMVAENIYNETLKCGY